MNNQQLALEVAKVVYPDAKAHVIKDEGYIFIIGVIKGYGAVIYEPHLNTERGRAQLMDLVFRLSSMGQLILTNDKSTVNPYCELTWNRNYAMWSGETIGEAILKLFLEVFSEGVK